ncbi:MAG TPA: type VI secretion system tip protein VgrG [Candidatus Sulfotelmatobacter sp.]|nr:type VI secretion system tip protein VgrG [Candidatus Sulfotelmatobacter sp.]
MPQSTDFVFSAGHLDSDDLRVLRYTGSEGISQCFVYDLELSTPETQIDFEDLVGEKCHLIVTTAFGERHVDGIVARWEEVGRTKDATYHTARLVPRVWTLNLIRQSRIFQGLSTPEILEQVLKGAGIPSDDYKLSLKGKYEARTYCVQYRESDFDFISRLMEEDGMFFFFEHTEDSHAMIIGDGPEVHAELPDGAEIRYREADSGMLGLEQVLHFRYARTLRPGAVMLKEFDFKKPSLALKATEKADAKKESKFESYDYPGEYPAQSIGDRLVKVRLQEERAESYLGQGETDCRRFYPGWKFTLADHPNDALNIEYLLVRVRHAGEQPHAAGGAGGGDAKKPVYRATFDCIPAAVSYRSPRVTPRPTIDGPQTAVVVGGSQDEIHCDDHGRVKVKFHWDRADTKGDKSSCWIRVSQAWGGAGWGTLFIPRVGQEVVVDFLEGDPDRPLITGRVYNATNPVPYKLPDNKTRTSIKSNSSPGGDGANELRFEDKKGNEQLFIQAEKDVDLYVKNDHREFFGRDKHSTVTRDHLTSIERDEHLLVDRDSLSDVTRDHSLKVGGKQMLGVTGTRTVKVTGDIHESTGGKFSLEASQGIYLKASSIVIEGSQAVTLKVGGNFVMVDPGGVTIVGSMIKLNSGGSAGSGTAVNAVPTVKPTKAIKAADAASSGAVKGSTDSSSSGSSSSSSSSSSDDRKSHKDPAKDAPQDKDKTWIEVELVDENKKPVAGEPYEVELPDGSIATGTTGADGVARIEGVDPGSCKVRFPKRDKGAWKKA